MATIIRVGSSCGKIPCLLSLGHWVERPTQCSSLCQMFDV